MGIVWWVEWMVKVVGWSKEWFSCVEGCVHMYSVFCHHVLCFLFAELSVLVWLACLPTCALCWHGGDLYKAHHTFPNPHYKPSPLQNLILTKTLTLTKPQPSPLQNLTLTKPHPYKSSPLQNLTLTNSHIYKLRTPHPYKP